LQLLSHLSDLHLEPAGMAGFVSVEPMYEIASAG
jgi:hypothetical protein